MIWSNAHAQTGMVGMCNVAGVWRMSGLWKAAADSCHLLCQDLLISSRAFIPLSLIYRLSLSQTQFVTYSHAFTLLYLFSIFYFSHHMSSFGHLHPNATEILDETLPPRAPTLTNHALFLQALTHIEPLRFHHLAFCMVKSCYNIYTSKACLH